MTSMDESFEEIMSRMRGEGIAKALSGAQADVNPSARRTEYRPIRKSASSVGDVGRRIETVAMLKARTMGAPRPDAVASVHGDAQRPNLESIRKSASSSPARPLVMGVGIDPRKAVERDWAEYNSFISNTE
jgi:hypothetical protein